MLGIVHRIVRYEEGSLDGWETIQLFSELVEHGVVWQLQGSYGRTARDLIEGGLLTTTGQITDVARDLFEGGPV